MRVNSGRLLKLDKAVPAMRGMSELQGSAHGFHGLLMQSDVHGTCRAPTFVFMKKC